MDTWAQRFPALFETTTVAYAPLVDLRFSLERPPEHLVSRVHVVGRTHGGVVVCATDLGWRFLPGGTREPDEDVVATVDRELAEEAGARRTSVLTSLGVFRASHRGAAPFRPHLPHPIGYWWFVACDVEVERPASNPSDGEQVTHVAVLAVEAAADFIAAHDPIHAAVVRLARALGHA